MKFSLVVPVYNVEDYVLKCLKSIDSQSYKNYEVIIVDDGATDNSANIIKKFIKNKKNFKYYQKENGGLSDARNYGVKYASGDYLLFIDSDDYVNKDLLQKLNELLEKEKFNIVRFGVNIVDEKGNLLKIVNNVQCNSNKKYNILKAILKNEFVEVSWLYAYSLPFWQKNNFSFTKGTIHEDFGLTPIIFSKVDTIGLLPYHGYNYVQRENSIMSSVSYEKIKKRTNDFKEHFILHRKKINNNTKENKLILGFSAEALIYKTRELKNKELEEMINYLQNEKVVNQIYPTTFKKYLMKYYLKLFLKKRIMKLSQEFHNEVGDN